MAITITPANGLFPVGYFGGPLDDYFGVVRISFTAHQAWNAEDRTFSFDAVDRTFEFDAEDRS